MPGFGDRQQPPPPDPSVNQTAFASPGPTPVGSNDPDPVAAASAGGGQPPIGLANALSTAVGAGPQSNLSTVATGITQDRGLADNTATNLATRPDTSIVPTPNQQSNQAPASNKKRRRLFLIIGGIVVFVVVAVAVAVPVAITQGRNSSSGSSASGDARSSPTSPFTGGDGSVITTENGTTFTYVNEFGGTWYDDPNDPFNNNAQAQSWSPPLSEEWDYQSNPMRGVNLGGWLVLDPLIVPSLFEPYLNANPPVRDEWTLSLAMAADTANGGLSQLEKHYDTFITEEDFAQIAGAGLNWIRLPIPFWAVE
ncbi:hypothetical protein FRC01_002947, partial [Tulasnella sp. 417]